MFGKESRYVQQPTYTVKDSRGRDVRVVTSPSRPTQSLLGLHKRRAGQRLDLLAYQYLDDPTGFWKICEINDVMRSDMLDEAVEISIPTKE